LEGFVVVPRFLGFLGFFWVLSGVRVFRGFGGFEVR